MAKTVHGDSVTVNGSEKYDSVDCGSFTVNGSAKVTRDLHANDVNINGSAKIGGNLDAHDLVVNGSAKIEGSVVAADANFQGSVKVDGLTDATDLSIEGAGSFGDVAARTFEVTVGGDSTADSVQASEIRVERDDDSSFLRDILGQSNGVFEADAIEGDTVVLDATRANTVVGEHVTLGPDAEIGTVYSDDLDAGDASVGDVRAYDEY